MSKKNKQRARSPSNEELETPCLPANFVDQVVFLESELEWKCSAQGVNKLIGLYSV